jgi:hypothetical protein
LRIADPTHRVAPTRLQAAFFRPSTPSRCRE